MVYADTLTFLYEDLARCLETHQPSVETYYGSDELLWVWLVVGVA